MRTIRIVAIAAFVMAGLGASLAQAQKQEAAKKPTPPMEIIKTSTAKVQKILSNPDLKGEEKQEKRRKQIRKAVSEHFDWRALARRSLGRHWRNRTEAEQKEFTALFRELLAKTYIKRIEKQADADISYEGQKIEEEYASVKAVARTKDDRKIPIEYRLHKVKRQDKEKKDEEKKGEAPKKPKMVWLIYDVKIEGVSLVNNYRSQFNNIVIGQSYESLVKKLRAKVEDDD